MKETMTNKAILPLNTDKDLAECRIWSQISWAKGEVNHSELSELLDRIFAVLSITLTIFEEVLIFEYSRLHLNFFLP